MPGLGFEGLPWNPPTNLDFAYYRAYDADLGRWLNEDPIGFEGGVNFYQYGDDNPVNRTDTLGLTAATNLKYLGSWLTGGGDTNRNYPPGSPEWNEMSLSRGLNKLRAKYRANNCQNTSMYYGTFEAARETLTRELTSTSAQVGGWYGSATNNGNGTVTYHIKNVSGTESFFYHVLPNRSCTDCVMRNITQDFYFTEKSPCCQ